MLTALQESGCNILIFNVNVELVLHGYGNIIITGFAKWCYFSATGLLLICENIITYEQIHIVGDAG